MVKQPKPPKASKQGKSAKDKLPEILPFTYDFMFKGAFSAPDGRESLANFLVALLPWLNKREFDKITFLPTRRIRRHLKGKECDFDIIIQLASGRILVIEVQVDSVPGIEKRAQFYCAKITVEQLEKGQHYHQVPQIVTIFILNYSLFKDDPEYFHEYRLINPRNGKELPHSAVFVFVELPKMPRKADGTPKWNWLRLFKAKTRKELESLAEKEPAMREAVMKAVEMSAAQANRYEAISREMRRRDQAARLYEAHTTGKTEGEAKGLAKGLAKGRVEGLAKGLAKGLAEGEAKGLAKGLAEGEVKGLAKGRAEGRSDVARCLLRKNMPLAEVASLTDLSLTIIKKLAAAEKA